MSKSKLLIYAYAFSLFIMVVMGCSIEKQNHNMNDKETQDVIPLSIEEQNQEFTKVIILFSEKIDKSVVEEVNGQVVEEIDTLPMLKANVPKKAIPILIQNENIISVERERVIETKPEDINWGIDDINIKSGVDSQLTGEGIKIAILDSGIDQDHKDLNIAGGASFVQYTDSYDDDNGHGTHVAGIVGALDNEVGMVGIAPDSLLYAVKVLDQNGEGYLFDIIAGIDWAVQNNMDIINMSIGTEEPSPALLAVLHKATKEETILVAAAGNNGNEEGVGDLINYPAHYPEVIAVGASTKNRIRASFSATGESLEFVAPGQDVISTFLDNQYVSMDGTSMATPFVSGVFALMKEKKSDFSLQSMRQQLQESAIDLGVDGKDPLYGFGLIQFPPLVNKVEEEEKKPTGSDSNFIEEKPEIKAEVTVNDIQNSWAENEILNVIENGWMIGTSEEHFSPKQPVTRAQAATILVRALKLPIEIYSVSSFTDVSVGFWARDEIETAKKFGLIQGIGNGQFAPKRPISREEMAVLLFRAMKIEATSKNDLSFYKDLSPERWSYHYVMSLSNKGIIQGFYDKTFRPEETLLREQMAVLMVRANPYFTE